MSNSHKGERVLPPTRLCLCSHNLGVHSRGFCGVCLRLGLSCPVFREDKDVPKLVPGGAWLASGRQMNPHVRHLKAPA